MSTVLNTLTHGGQSLQSMDAHDQLNVHLLNARFLQQLNAQRQQQRAGAALPQPGPHPYPTQQPLQRPGPPTQPFAAAQPPNLFQARF